MMNNKGSSSKSSNVTSGRGGSSHGNKEKISNSSTSGSGSEKIKTGDKSKHNKIYHLI